MAFATPTSGLGAPGPAEEEDKDMEDADFSARLKRHICPRNSMSNEGVLDAQEAASGDFGALHCAILWIGRTCSSGHVDIRGLCSDPDQPS